ncbi:tetratricopeptide repeat protein [Longimicrobium sp.]|uniref:tetratricopeptide repeat protein n=1 Tax=Longimicrobium sp. TaxID=2029185 RepID=UPI003B3A8079
MPVAQPAGVGIFADLPPADAVLLWRVLRLVLSYARGDYDRRWFDAGRLRVWEKDLLLGAADVRFRSACAVIVDELVDPDHADMECVAHACWCIVDWALDGDRSVATALAFTEAAALTWPVNARYALAAGRLFRRNGKPREGEAWLNRSRRLAAHYSDHECLVLSTSSLAMLYWEQGSLKQAQRFLTRAQRVARRNGLRTLEGEVLHNLLVVAIDRGELDSAEAFAQAAFDRYMPDHLKLPALAYDTAYLWLSRGHTRRALRVFQALLPHFSETCAQVQVLCATCKAAGMTGARDVFASCASRVAEITGRTKPDSTRAAALVDLGVGALALGENQLAESALTDALTLARERGLSDTLMKADEALDQLRRGERVWERRPYTDARQPQEELAARFTTALSTFVSAGCV